MTQLSPASDFVERLRRAATSVGCFVSGEESYPCIEQCGPAELSLLLTYLHESGYSIVSSRPNSGQVQLGIMKSTDGIPEFFSVHLARGSVNLPRTDGLFLVFLGPDGVGKTTTIDLVTQSLKPIFGDQRLFHWRPQLIKPRTTDEELNVNNGWTSLNRHGEPPRGTLVSLVRLGGVFADYWLGQRKVVRPVLSSGGLVVFDRYYHDILVDSRRYRYGGPQWLLKGLQPLLPQRKVFFVVLDAEEDAILMRKQEVTSEELRSQRKKYAALARSLHCLHVRTDFGLDNTLTQILTGVGRHLTHRFDEKLHHVKNMAVAEQRSARHTTVAKTA